MRPWAVLARREVGSIFRERTILLAIAIQVVVAGFSSFIVVGLSALVDPEAAPGFGEPIVAVNRSAVDPDLVARLNAAHVRVEPHKDDASAWGDFVAGGAHAALLVRPGEPLQITLGLPDGDLRSTIILTRLKQALEAHERALRDERAERLSFEPIYVAAPDEGGSYEFVYALLIPLLVFLPVVLAGALCADSLTEEIQRGTLPALLASPATPADVIAGKLLANLALAPLLAAAWLGLLALNGLAVPLAGAAAILGLAAGAAFLTCVLGCAIALVTRDRNRAQAMYATAFFGLVGGSFALPLSPVNAVALLAAGTPEPSVPLLLAGTLALAAAAWVALAALLRRATPWMAAGLA